MDHERSWSSYRIPVKLVKWMESLSSSSSSFWVRNNVVQSIKSNIIFQHYLNYIKYCIMYSCILESSSQKFFHVEWYIYILLSSCETNEQSIEMDLINGLHFKLFIPNHDAETVEDYSILSTDA